MPGWVSGSLLLQQFDDSVRLNISYLSIEYPELNEGRVMSWTLGEFLVRYLPAILGILFCVAIYVVFSRFPSEKRPRSYRASQESYGKLRE